MPNTSRTEELQPGEQVVLFLRPVWYILLGDLIGAALLYLVPAVLCFIFWGTLSSWFAMPLVGPWLVLLVGAYAAIIWLFLFRAFTDYYLNTWLVTSFRIIDADQLGIFKRRVSELHLANVQDVTTEVKGVFQTMLNFGDVLVQTASEEDLFRFENAPRPDHVKEEIMKLVEAEKAKYRVPAPGVPGSPV